MNIGKSIVSLASGLSLLAGTGARSQNLHTLTIQGNKHVAEVSPNMWGIFFEDINFSADGGLYAELIKNRSFEFPKPLMGWKETKVDGGSGKVLIVNSGSANTRRAHIEVDSPNGWYGLTNEGFRGIGVKKDEQYNFSVLARKSGDANMVVRVELLDTLGNVIGSSFVNGLDNSWKKLTASINATATVGKAVFRISFQGNGQLDADVVSLFPQHIWKNRPNGLRADLVQMLADMKPGFVRFPGGCIVEGKDLVNRYQWKNTVGDVDARPLMLNRWNTEFPVRLTSDYFQTFGLGFFEYFQLSEDIGAEPLPILNCGMACQYNTAEVVDMDSLDAYIQDALDLVEFANGSVATKWGKLRATMGHPAPFHLKYMGVGNEQWDRQYIERYRLFEKAIKQKYPEIQLVGSSGPRPDGGQFDYLWKEMRSLHPSLVDEHYYRPPEWFFANATRYDQYSRTGPKVFAGEYAAHGKEDKNPASKNTWISALAEAAFMTGLERNADVVRLASYAPLFAHVEAWQWRPDLIWFDNLGTVATPNYYVQKLYALNKGTTVVPILENNNVLAGKDSLYASSVLDTNRNELIVKIANASKSPTSVQLNIAGLKMSQEKIIVTNMSASDDVAYNSFENKTVVVPKEKTLDKLSTIVLEGHAFYVIKMKYKKK